MIKHTSKQLPFKRQEKKEKKKWETGRKAEEDAASFFLNLGSVFD